MIRAPLEVGIVNWLPNWRVTEFLIIAGLVLLLASQAAATPLPDHPIPPPPDPLVKSNLTCRYVYISYPNAGADSLGQDLIDEVPAELEAFMEDQANSVYTYDIASVTVPGDRYRTWMADYDTTVYIADWDSMTYNLAEACTGARGEVHAEILTEILATYDLACWRRPRVSTRTEIHPQTRTSNRSC